MRRKTLITTALNGALFCLLMIPAYAQGIRGPQNAPSLAYPKGISKLYAMQGSNQILLFGTPKGYRTATTLVNAIDGDLDIISARIDLVQTTREWLTRLGATLGADNALTATDIQTLVAAQRQGRLLPPSDSIRFITRQYTAVDLLMGRSADLPLTVVPRIEADGRIGIELTTPVEITANIAPNTTSVIALPNGDTGKYARVSLLFITPKIFQSDARP